MEDAGMQGVGQKAMQDSHADRRAGEPATVGTTAVND
jgi:hypothetical protein